MSRTKKIEWHTEKRKVKDLIPYELNPRQMTEKQAKDLEKSLNKFNLAEIPAINTNNIIIAGHQRIAILMQLGRGEEEIDVRLPSRKLTKKEFEEYNIRSNKNIGAWNWDMLANYNEQDLIDYGFDELIDPDSINVDAFYEQSEEKNKEKICPHCGKNIYDPPEEKEDE